MLSAKRKEEVARPDAERTEHAEMDTAQESQEGGHVRQGAGHDKDKVSLQGPIRDWIQICRCL